MNKKAVVIGSGIGGLASAVRLATKGYRVTVFEAASSYGGKMLSLEDSGFRFDKGPSLFTMPHLVENLISHAGKKPQHYIRYKQLPIACNYFWEDGTTITGYSDGEQLSREVEEKLGVNRKVITKYLKHSGRMYDLAGKIFLEKSLHKTSTFLSAEALKAIINLYRLDIHRSMHAANIKQLKHPKLVQYFNRFATYNGSNPFKAPGILNMIPGLEHNRGAYFPEGGMIAIPQSIFRLGLDLGVEFHFNSYVSEIKVAKGKVSGVMVNGSEFEADVVVSNMDVFFTYKKLLPHQPSPENVLSQERSSSAMVFYWGVNRKFDNLELHNIFFSEDYNREFEALFSDMTVSDDPTVYVNISSKEKPDDAPAGKENWFVMVNAPHDQGQDWNEIAARARANVIRKLSKVLKAPIDRHIETELRWDPVTIERDTFSYRGSIYGTSSNNRMAAFFRHPNFSNKIKGLYFVGGSVHPGGGIPLSLLSAKIMSELVS